GVARDSTTPARTTGRAGPATAGRGDRSPPRRSARPRRGGAADRRRAASASRADADRPSVDDGDLDRGDRRQVVGDLAPALTLVGAREHLARARSEVEAGHLVRVDRHSLAVYADL